LGCHICAFLCRAPRTWDIASHTFIHLHHEYTINDETSKHRLSRCHRTLIHRIALRRTTLHPCTPPHLSFTHLCSLPQVYDARDIYSVSCLCIVVFSSSFIFGFSGMFGGLMLLLTVQSIPSFACNVTTRRFFCKGARFVATRFNHAG